ncbi:MAG: peptidoglycan editing factor PgeF [Megasphaera sp.]|jgi:YfiH family protein|nr:peptidoglycan editing factor PgeF [Megasphaera sp.]MCH4218422.1 peptidoglycan editing factor PgeF [Megasphaera sp.]
MLNEQNGISYVTFSVFDDHAVTAAVSTRKGGVSSGPYASLNMSFASGDEPANVLANRKKFLTTLHIDATQLISCNQIHGINIVPVGKEMCGRGSDDKKEAIEACDGIMTNEAGVPISMNFGDCTPILFFDPVHQVIAICHGGWRGTAQNIVAVTLQKMHSAYGTNVADVRAAIGPAIGKCCFEVGQDVIDAFLSIFSQDDIKTLSTDDGNGKFHFDLPGANEKLMLKAGILPEHLENANICTCCHEDLFFSYRRSNKRGEKSGRHMAVMQLVKTPEVQGDGSVDGE